MMKTHVDLELGGTTYRLVPGPKALLRIANEVRDPMDMFIEMRVGEITGKMPKISHIFRTLYIALVESGHDLPEEKVNELLFKYGAGEVYGPFAEFVGGLLNRGEVPDIEVTTDEEPARPKKANRAPRARKSTGRRS